MIQSFASKETERLWLGRESSSFDSRLAQRALGKLQVLNAATSIRDLAALPGNRVEKLKGNRAGQHSIGINNQWRICFHWTEIGPRDVEIIDYH